MTRSVYGPDRFEMRSVELGDLEAALEPVEGRVVWLDIHGVGNVDAIRDLGSKLGLHPLTLEDIVHVHQRAKVEEFDDHLFVVLRAMRVAEEGHVDNEQFSMVLRPGLLVTIQERPGDGFDPVRRRIREGKGALRKSGADYLLYALVDAVTDNYFPVLDAYAETMDALDQRARDNPTPDVSRSIHMMRRELRQLRRATSPLRDLAGQLARSDIDLLSDPVQVALRDCHDHALQVNEFVEGARERASDLADLYMVMVGERTNRVMQLLTIVATIFIPLTFLCGLYGMNFDPEVSPYNMPELKWRYGYPAFWGAMILLFVGMLWYFRRKGWLGSPDGSSQTPSD
ncbi:MAG: magnesium/cobalt transporter CorA [Deltaproteobacteria bacterium]|nr:magnesium/cobalt transporter CorA [Deltaproteobacteria bacterium]MBW2535035.1 magnesium/cobalt transporter CorA [Deltaproteobacteria bacterium]